jgi:hypothetical protein
MKCLNLEVWKKSAKLSSEIYILKALHGKKYLKTTKWTSKQKQIVTMDSSPSLCSGSE